VQREAMDHRTLYATWSATAGNGMDMRTRTCGELQQLRRPVGCSFPLSHAPHVWPRPGTCLSGPSVLSAHQPQVICNAGLLLEAMSKQILTGSALSCGREELNRLAARYPTGYRPGVALVGGPRVWLLSRTGT
jgi:hypothetical protein